MMLNGRAHNTEELINKLDVADLSTQDQAGFKDWLTDRPSMLTAIENALRRGQLVKANVHTFRKKTEYSVWIDK